MQLKSLFLKNFTNYTSLTYQAGELLNLLIGDNAQGKSNLLDAIYYLSGGSSNRYPSDQDLVQWGTDYFQIQGETVNKNSMYQLKFSWLTGKKQVEVNGAKVQKIADIIGLFNVVFFSPDDLFLVKGNPSLRRKYLDNEISQVSPKYYYNLQQYRKILLQRNNLLKAIKLKKAEPEDLTIWDQQLAKTGAWLIMKRLEMLRKLKPLARLAHRKMTGGLEELEISYSTSLLQSAFIEKNPEDFAVYYLSRLGQALEEDIFKGYTTLGPHRDDFDLKINGINARVYGSQGQQRTAALSLKLAELEFMFAETGEYPVLLLDDVLSELDKNRREQLLATVSDKVQTFITCTETNYLSQALLNKADIYQVVKGNLKKIKAH
ncbi:DNA replication/repair protein RecF [Zhaonella formicivorans]|uniref:DNA replication/repair protein RecF n=1 Tax=Zhaonella formicivorans TaxID=2528593 RepID=UPI0010DF6462|nr:DNA replication/repair protein RecF [Zhaonella formicivorans]